MKNSTASNRKTGRMIAKNLIILVVLVFVAILAMWAWFTNNSSATANGINVTCKAPDSLEIAIVPHTNDSTKKEVPDNDAYCSSITLGSQDFVKNLNKNLSEVTSDGVTFLKPTLIQSNGVASPDPTGEWSVAEPNERYLSFDLYIRSKGPHSVYLDKGSKFSTVSKVLNGEGAGNLSPGTTISKDAIVGATRFSVFTNDDAKTRKLLWIPRPDLYFTSDAVGSEILAEDVKSGVTYKHQYWTDQHKQDKIDDTEILTTSEKIGNEYVLGTKGAKTEIAYLSNTANFGTDDEPDMYFYTSVVCNMWIEGDDTEARKALVGGKFTIDLNLTIKE